MSEAHEPNIELINHRISRLEQVTEEQGKQIAMLLRVAWIVFGIVAAIEFLPTAKKVMEIL